MTKAMKQLDNEYSKYNYEVGNNVDEDLNNSNQRQKLSNGDAYGIVDDDRLYKYYSPDESYMDGMDESSTAYVVLKIPKSIYPNILELNYILRGYRNNSHGVEGNPGGRVSKTNYSISNKKSTPEYWYVTIIFESQYDI
jgi:hypothetical protein